MYTKEQHEAVLKQIIESDNAETTLNLIQSLRTDFEDTTEKMVQATTKASDMENKYNTTRQAYIDRFFTNPGEVKKKQEEDTNADATPKTFDDLFKRKGDK
jgi:glutamyl-tRNA reductase